MRTLRSASLVALAGGRAPEMLPVFQGKLINAWVADARCDLLHGKLGPQHRPPRQIQPHPIKASEGRPSANREERAMVAGLALAS